MKHSKTPAFLVLSILAVCLFNTARAQESVRISEFMAVNNNGLDDEDRDEEDWIELHNTGASAVNLDGWYLTDDADVLTKWSFPNVTLAPGAFLVVFASGKDRIDPSGVLHTNFKLSGDGEYLGLVRPDGRTVVSEFAPAFPIQAPDISYGYSASNEEVALVQAGAPAKAFIPMDDSLEPGTQEPDTLRPWTLPGLDDSSWQEGITGVGFGYPDLVSLDVSAMISVNQTVYIRIPFEIENPAMVQSLTMLMTYEDGFVAYINGHEVARDNAPEPGTETWNSGSSAYRINRVAVRPVEFPIPEYDFLRVGTNILAIQGFNYFLDSPNLLVLPELTAKINAYADTPPHYFPTPTPGKPNNAGVERLGPIISDNDHRPEIPGENENLSVTARIEPSFDSVDRVELHYRIMFDNEVVIPLLDNGNARNGDIIQGDGVYGALIPAEAFGAGQMVRWFISATDTAGRESQYPPYLDPANSPRYDGTVVDDPSLVNELPVLHWFIENPNAANSDAGTRCVFFYDGVFYDNISINLHGQSSRSFPKKSYDVDFHPGYNFKWAAGQPRADDINLMTTYPDKAQMRNILAYAIYRDADCPYHWVFPVRVQQNAAFWGTAHIMENGDEDWLIRMGINAEGALYKMYNKFDTATAATTGAEKKTRKYEDNSDLAALFDGLSQPTDERRRYMYDNVDVAEVVNFLAVRAITGDTDCCHKNYYLYRDTGVSNEWQMWPWDVDLSFGRVWNSSETYWNENLITNTRLFVGGGNRVPDAIFNTPETRQMYLRRVRTLMDEFLMAPGTPEDQLYFEPQIDMLAVMIAADAMLDAEKWGSDSWGNGSTAPCCKQSLLEAADELRNSYLPERRRQLFSRLASGTGELPTEQPSRPLVRFGTIDTTPVGGNMNEQYIQLQNLTSAAVDISSWQIKSEQDPNTPLFVFRGGTVLPVNGAVYVAADRVAFRSRPTYPTGGNSLLVVGDMNGRLAAKDEMLTLIDRKQEMIDSVVTTEGPRR